MKMIANWQDKKLTCYFCGETRSVKYMVEEFDRFKSDEPFEVCSCNKCALEHDLLTNKK